jgi:hypothetical protein
MMQVERPDCSIRLWFLTYLHQMKAVLHGRGVAKISVREFPMSNTTEVVILTNVKARIRDSTRGCHFSIYLIRVTKSF